MPDMLRQTSDSYRDYEGLPSWPPNAKASPTPGNAMANKSEPPRTPPRQHRTAKPLLKRHASAKSQACAMRRQNSARKSAVPVSELAKRYHSGVNDDFDDDLDSCGSLNSTGASPTRRDPRRITHSRSPTRRAGFTTVANGSRSPTSSMQEVATPSKKHSILKRQTSSTIQRIAQRRQNAAAQAKNGGGSVLAAESDTFAQRHSGTRRKLRSTATGKQTLLKGRVYAAFEALKVATDLAEIQDAASALDVCSKRGSVKESLQSTYKVMESVASNNYTNLRIFEILERYISKPEYASRKCSQHCVLVVGAGPVGLRLAIELRALGAEVHVVEKRKSFTRANILHLWPWVVHDVTALGGKFWNHLFGLGKKFVHFGTKELQCILLKTAVLLGIRLHDGHQYLGITEAYEDVFEPPLETTSSMPFNIVVDCGGAAPTLAFNREYTETSRAIGVVAQFEYHGTREEKLMEEFAWARQFNFELFHDLDAEGLELENCVYYKGSVHYFCFTPSKRCLLARGVLKENLAKDDLLRKGNIDNHALDKLVGQLACHFNLPLNCCFIEGDKHTTLFDFSKLSRAVDGVSVVALPGGGRKMYALCGDALLEPFWPEGLGVVRGNLIALDTAWMISRVPRSLENVDVALTERYVNYAAVRGLSQFTAKATLQKDFGLYTVDPSTRYLHEPLNRKIRRPKHPPLPPNVKQQGGSAQVDVAIVGAKPLVAESKPSARKGHQRNGSQSSVMTSGTGRHRRVHSQTSVSSTTRPRRDSQTSATTARHRRGSHCSSVTGQNPTDLDKPDIRQRGHRRVVSSSSMMGGRSRVNSVTSRGSAATTDGPLFGGPLTNSVVAGPSIESGFASDYLSERLRSSSKTTDVMDPPSVQRGDVMTPPRDAATKTGLLGTVKLQLQFPVDDGQRVAGTPETHGSDADPEFSSDEDIEYATGHKSAASKQWPPDSQEGAEHGDRRAARSRASKKKQPMEAENGVEDTPRTGTREKLRRRDKHGGKKHHKAEDKKEDRHRRHKQPRKPSAIITGSESRKPSAIITGSVSHKHKSSRKSGLESDVESGGRGKRHGRRTKDASDGDPPKSSSKDSKAHREKKGSRSKSRTETDRSSVVSGSHHRHRRNVSDISMVFSVAAGDQTATSLSTFEDSDAEESRRIPSPGKSRHKSHHKSHHKSRHHKSSHKTKKEHKGSRSSKSHHTTAKPSNSEKLAFRKAAESKRNRSVAVGAGRFRRGSYGNETNASSSSSSSDTEEDTSTDGVAVVRPSKSRQRRVRLYSSGYSDEDLGTSDFTEDSG